jgi:flavin-dependent dehydrogenase
LRQAGVDAVILDKSQFPRNKVCGGWITLDVIQQLAIDPADYTSTRVLQPITGFKTSTIGAKEIESDYGRVVSYGIRRVEFDDYLLQRSGARLMLGSPIKSIERTGSTWLVNGDIQARLLIGAGGHFCPVARHLGANARKEVAVAAQEVEFEMSPVQQSACSIRGEVPELFFCADIKGYGWCFRKGNYLNVGLGRLDPHSLPSHVADFVQFLRQSGKIGFDLPVSMHGHAYLIYRESNRNVISDGALLIGDSAGLAFSQSGEGILPAIESGLLAADAIIAAKGNYSPDSLAAYKQMLAARFGEQAGAITQLGRRLPDQFMQPLARLLLATRWFSRKVVLDQWFLHSQPAA